VSSVWRVSGVEGSWKGRTWKNCGDELIDGDNVINTSFHFMCCDRRVLSCVLCAAVLRGRSQESET